VQIVSDVEPYELMKLRLLNASHQALCYPGYLVGYRFVHDVTTDPLFARFLLDYMTSEAIPTLRPVPGVDLVHYANQLIERFSNPEVRDTVARLCANASDLIPKFLLPVVRQQLATDGPFTRSAAVVASWARYAEGTDENGETHEMDDNLAPQLEAAARRQRQHRTAFLDDNRAVFGELADDTRFTQVYSSILTSLQERGVRETFADLDHWADHPAGQGAGQQADHPAGQQAGQRADHSADQGADQGAGHRATPAMAGDNPAMAEHSPDGRERKSP